MLFTGQYSMLFFLNKSSLLYINFSKGLENTYTIDTSLSPFLNKGFIFAFFIMSGKVPF